MKNSFIILCFILCFCTNHTQKHLYPYFIAKKSELMPNVRCNKYPDESYALYIPKNNDSLKKLPVIIFFDSHGKGKYPLELYKNLSEKYKMVLVGSNKIQNGMNINEAMNVYENLINDLKQKISIDTQMIFISGFSGGARMACEIAQSYKEISGVIACSAGIDISRVHTSPTFYYVSIAGNYDMNYSEILSVDQYMEKISACHQLLLFNGKHQWPPVETMNEAILFILLKSMLAHPEMRNDSVIQHAVQYFSIKEKEIKTKPDKLELLRFEQLVINSLDGLSEVNENKKLLANLFLSSQIKVEINDELKIQQQENIYKQKIVDAFAIKDIKWWQEEVNLLHKKIASSPQAQSAMFMRILSYASLVSFSYSNNALRNNQSDALMHFLQIYTLVDPDNADCAYLWACYYININDTKNALKSLNDAVLKGFNDVIKLNTDPYFTTLKNDTAFSSLLKKIRN